MQEAAVPVDVLPANRERLAKAEPAVREAEEQGICVPKRIDRLALRSIRCVNAVSSSVASSSRVSG
jgi:hypothetical protein